VRLRRARVPRFACAALLLAGALAGATGVGWAGDDAPTQGETLLLAALRQRYDDIQFHRCAAAPRIVLNEVCSVGSDCDPDVRIADFVEVYNPSGQTLELDCYVVINDDALPFVPRGRLAPRAVAAWAQAELGFGLAKTGDRVRLYRMHAEGGDPGLVLIDLVELADFRVFYRRVPDGGAWQTLSLRAAEIGVRSSFGKPNS
jgi:hypothetical protein